MIPDDETGNPLSRLALYAALGVLAFAPALAAQETSVGLSSVRAQRFENEVLPPYVPQQEDHFAYTLAAGDFNGDGADDLATGIPFDNCLVDVGPADCGSVVVRYGVPGAGLATGLADQILNQQESGSPDPAEAEDMFGLALAACDFDFDGFDDLAVGVPQEDLTLGGTLTIVDSGIVEIYYGTSAGLASPASAVLKSNGIQSGQQRLGEALACGDFDTDGFDDLVVGLPGRNVGGDAGAGRILVYPGSPAGVGAGAIGLDQDSPGMPGEAEAGDAFGAALAVGNFNDDFFDDLAIGVPGENVFAGAVHWLLGDPEDIIVTTLSFVFFEDALGGSPEAGDRFGHAFAVGDFDDDGHDDLAIGVPFEDLGVFEDTGNVGVVYGQQFFGLPFVRSQGFDQDALLGAGNTESGDGFGFALASGDFDRDGRDDLAIGHPLERDTEQADGAVTVVMGSPAVGLSPARRRFFASGFDGIPGDPDEHFKLFGRALAAGDFDGDGHGDLAIGIPHENEDDLFDVGVEVVLYGSLFADGFESGFALWSIVAQ